MAPLIAEGDSLGEVHKNFNTKVRQVVDSGMSFDDVTREFGSSDLEQLLKIEVAAKTKHVDYILQILKSNDMLHVSRAINKTPWLITDERYAHIINPEYLHSQLFPEMTCKAISKFMSNIKLNLKDEKRVDEFYKYFEKIDLNKAVRWLPNCSLDLIISVTKKHPGLFNTDLIIRLCRKTFVVFENMHLRGHGYFEEFKFLLNVQPEVYLNALEKTHSYNWPRFGKKHTALIMNKCPERILNNFGKYATYIDMETLGKHIGSQNIEKFIVEQVKTEPQFMLQYKNVKPLVKLMPKENKFEFLKTFFINKKHDESNLVQCDAQYESPMECASFRMAARRPKRKIGKKSGKKSSASSKHIYQWYRHAPFETAMLDLKKLLRSESSPEERGAMFRVLLTSAGSNMNNIKTLLQFYIERHINEPFRFKVNFVNAVVSTTATYRYDHDTWNMLHQLFHSMEVYIESDNNVQFCVEAVIVYHVLHKLPIPGVIENKFTFDTFKKIQKKLSEEEKETVFRYIYTHVENKLRNKSLEDLEGATDAFLYLESIFSLLIDWNKDLKDFPYIIEKTKEIIRINRERKYDMSLEYICYMNKSWSRYFFEESLFVSQKLKVCVNIIKHDIRLLEKFDAEMETIRRDDKLDLRYLLTKLNVYWPQSVGPSWANKYRSRMEQPESQRATVRGLCALLPQEEFLDFLRKHAPVDAKIVWSETNEVLLGLRKTCAKLMYSARPQPPPDSVLQYARGDYLQFALPSLISIFYNLSSLDSRRHLPKLIDNAVSLKKHGIRMAFIKLNHEELKAILESNWRSCKNSSIRAVMFKKTFESLQREKNPARIIEIWTMLKEVIDNLTNEENKDIYVLLGEVDKVPLAVRGEFCMKSLKLLSSLPAKTNCNSITEKVCLYTSCIMDQIDPTFIETVVLNFCHKLFKNKSLFASRGYGFSYQMLDVISSYLLFTTDKKEQKRRFDKVFNVILDYSIEMWESESEESSVVKTYFENLLNSIIKTMTQGVKTNKCAIPENIFNNVASELEKRLAVEENYHIITYTKFIALYVKCCLVKESELKAIPAVVKSSGSDDEDDDDKTNKKISELLDEVNMIFAKQCVEILKIDVDKFFNSIQTLFTYSLKQFYGVIHMSYCNLDFGIAMVKDHDYVPAYITVIDLCGGLRGYYNDDDEGKKKQLRGILLAHSSKEVLMHYHKML